MELNLTVFIQIIHFVIAYFILERFFFRPAFSVVQENDERLLLLQEGLFEEKKSFSESAIKAEEWRLSHQKKLIEAVPSFAKKIDIQVEDENIISDNALTIPSEQQLKEIVQLCQQQLLNKFLS